MIQKYLEVKEKKEKELQSKNLKLQPGNFISVKKQQLDLLNKRVLSASSPKLLPSAFLQLEDLPKNNNNLAFKTSLLLGLRNLEESLNHISHSTSSSQ